MPEQVPKCERFIQRLAEGASRARLVDPILAARPPLVVVAAPSGYGKTVLAAQVAIAEAFASVCWVRGSGDGGTAEDALGLLADLIQGAPHPPSSRSTVECRNACHESLSSIPDGNSILAVFDDAWWAGEPGALATVEEAMAEAPVGSVALVTAREAAIDEAIARRVWTIEAEQLRLTDQELSEVWTRHGGSVPKEAVVRDLAAATGRHAALLSLMARNASLMGYSTVPPQLGTTVAALVNSLCDTQLDLAERDLLEYASVLGQGEVAVLARFCDEIDVAGALERIARVLPLVSVSSGAGHGRFMVHDLVSESRGSAAMLARRDRRGLAAAVEAMALEGRYVRALSTAAHSGLPEVLSEFLAGFGSQMLRTSSWESVVQSLGEIQAAVVAADARLLAVRAEADWATGKRSQAIQEAQLAIRMEELADPSATSPTIRPLLAGMRMMIGDFAGLAADVTPLLDRGAALPADDMAGALYAALWAYAFQGDLEALEVCREAASAIIAGGSASPFHLCRLDTVLGLLADIFEGDSPKAVRLFSRCLARLGAPSHGTASARGNLAAACLDAGDTEGASHAISSAIRYLGDYCTGLDRNLTELIADSIEALRGTCDDIRPSIDRVLASCEAEGERFTLVMSCVAGAQVALSTHRTEYAMAVAERGLAAAIETGSPVLTWLAELVQGLCSLAAGDVERARAAATRILPHVEAISAMGHVLHARLILAEVALNDEDLALAVSHLSAVSDHIIDKSPALIVACYLRAFPDLLGPLALAMGVDAVPIRVLNLVNGDYGRKAFDVAASVLTKPELRRLKARVRHEEQRVAAREKAALDEPAVCEVRLLGGLHVKAPHGVVSERDWTKRKARLLFAMLVSRGTTDIPRGEIIEYLWPDMDEERGLSNFYVVWSAMKRALSPGGLGDPASPFVEHTHGVCRVIAGRVVSDLDQFRKALSSAREAHASGDSAAELAALLGAVGLYRGDVLPGDVYDDWFGPVRERFKHDYEDAALCAGRLYANAGEPLEGLRVLRDASTHNPWREDLYQAILRLQIATGQRAAAIETYLMCRSRLVEDLGLDPSRETTALYEEVLGMEDR